MIMINYGHKKIIINIFVQYTSVFLLYKVTNHNIKNTGISYT